MPWKVKNEIPTGRITCSSGRSRCQPSRRSVSPTWVRKKPQYLKKIRMPRLAVTPATSTARRRFDPTGSWPSALAAPQLISAETISKATKRQSQAP